MTDLVREGKIYIACPPLYKIVRKRKERYVDDDAELNQLLIENGSDEVRLKNLADGKQFSPAQIKDILELLQKLDRLSEAVRRHGGDFEGYLSARDKKKSELPGFLVKLREGNEESVLYFHNEDEVRTFHEDNRDLNLFEEEIAQGQLALDGEDADLEKLPAKKAKKDANGRRRARLVELHESAAVQKIISELARKGLKIEHYADSDQPIFELTEGEGEKAVVHPLFSIPEILNKVIEIGKKGMTIQRFKGLGEMNPKELFQTTMDPDKRKLLRVALNEENAVDADKIFTILMGDVVEPRRQFIEDNALNARLDV
jgi:DNA gyrase subunit B